jgi:F0F1-type ATP synthase membrane subunit a
VAKLSITLQKYYFWANFMPNGSPRSIGLLLVFIEIMSFFSRIVSLAVRLFANITAGHILLKILSGFSLLFLFICNIYIFLIIIPNVIITSLALLESTIALLQAYVFISLVLLYLIQAYGH